ncbi:hypothetical protein CEXT_151371 [Caerostris extrusa]|uniref:Uncharacterized protein n=1 Tax=Caerostris extrusa TaxID=172846 RepID=A0AAV4MBE5_CAEEX|nr:hypothetical protein CEXT_151371 [Caerostris extrusa]
MVRPDGEVSDHYPFDLFTANTPDSGARKVEGRGGKHFLGALKEIHAPGRVIKTSFIGLGVKPIYRIPSESLMARPDGEVSDHYPFDLFTANTPDSGTVMKFWGRFYLCFDRRREILYVAPGTTYRGYRKEIKNWPDTYIFDVF